MTFIGPKLKSELLFENYEPVKTFQSKQKHNTRYLADIFATLAEYKLSVSLFKWVDNKKLRTPSWSRSISSEEDFTKEPTGVYSYAA